MLDFLWLRFSLILSLCHNLIVQTRLIQGRRIRYQITNICWIIEKEREFWKKKYTSTSLTMLKLLSVWITTSYGKYFKKWEYQATLLVSWEICMKVKNEQFNLDMEQLTGSKLGKKLTKMYIPITQNARLDESQARIKISCWCMAKPIQYCKVISLQLKLKKKDFQ